MEEKVFKNEEEYASQAGTGALLNPRVDSTFKALFTQDTKESKAAMQSFLEAATERKIRKWNLTANEPPEEFAGQRSVSYDIVCEFDDGMAADIEMQAFNQEYDYGKRSEYQVARLETTYLKKGDDWEKAPTVYQISVLDFNYGAGDADGDTLERSKSPVSRYAMRTKDGRELSNALNIIFVELPKAKGLEDSVETNTALENWAIFLKDADNPNKKDIISKLTGKEDGFMNAQKSLSSISANRNLWIAQYHQELHERDRISGLNAAHQRGLDEGRKEGRKEGHKEGHKEGLADGVRMTARNLLALGMSDEIIAKATGLSEDEIRKLR